MAEPRKVERRSDSVLTRKGVGGVVWGPARHQPTHQTIDIRKPFLSKRN